MKQAELFGGPAVRVATATRGAVRAHAGERETSRAATRYWSAAVAVVAWSVSYLVRQPGVSARTLAPTFSPVGDFALEGMLLALAWLALLLVACLALISGAAQIREP